MKKIISVVFLTLLLSTQALSVTLKEALIATYKNNTELNAERENINVSKEDLNISKSNYLPSLTISGSKSEEETNKLTNQSGGNATINDVNPLTKSIKVEQTLLDFGRGADLQKNRIGVRLAEAKLLKKEQDILYKAIEAYTGLIFANEKYNINKKKCKSFRKTS